MAKEKKNKQENIMRELKMDKVVLSVSGTADKLEKGKKLLEILSGKKVAKKKSVKRIPSLGVRPGLEVGAMVTLRGSEAEEMLRRLFVAIDKKLKKKQISSGTFSFGIKEYIEIPGIQYQRDIGMMGLDVSVSFYRMGKRVKLRKIKPGKIPRKNDITEEEIINFMTEKFGVAIR